MKNNVTSLVLEESPHRCIKKYFLRNRYMISDTISMWAVERCRTRIYRYGVDYVRKKFKAFVRDEAMCVRIRFGSAPYEGFL